MTAPHPLTLAQIATLESTSYALTMDLPINVVRYACGCDSTDGVWDLCLHHASFDDGVEAGVRAVVTPDRQPDELAKLRAELDTARQQGGRFLHAATMFGWLAERWKPADERKAPEVRPWMRLPLDVQLAACMAALDASNAVITAHVAALAGGPSDDLQETES